ncbi:MAG TPA: hypothetical protein VFF68_03980 [Anaerolineaceae bacterium]|nr:hypothetical protein [Anaerolineaceae bacterium]
MTSYPLAEVIPLARRLRLPFSRDQLLLLMAAFNLFMLGLETYLAHLISGTLVPYEWIPVIGGPVLGVILLAAGLIAFRNRIAANLTATLALLASIVIGVLGTYFHLVRAVLPHAPLAERVSLPLLVWAPPLLAPIMFALIGVLGMSAAWQEDPAGSGRLVLPGGARLQMPYSKTRAYFFVAGVGSLFTVISSVLDHARTGMVNPWVWLPLAVGVFATTVSFAVGFLPRLTRYDLTWYLLAMGLMVLVGVVGAGLHAVENWAATGQLFSERFIRGAPALAPLLFANMGAIGLLALFETKS